MKNYQISSYITVIIEFTVQQKKEPIKSWNNSGFLPNMPNSLVSLLQNLINYILKYPQAHIGIALRGIYTVAQLKHLRKDLDVNNEVPVGRLNEKQWASIFETMVRRVPQSSWPKIRN